MGSSNQELEIKMCPEKQGLTTAFVFLMSKNDVFKMASKKFVLQTVIVDEKIKGKTWATFGLKVTVNL